LGRRSLLPQRRQRLAFQALRELQSMQIFFTSVLASASGNLAIGSPAVREREMPYIILTAPGQGSDCPRLVGVDILGLP
jgi:hypothetical protein